jgi:hypothetical protein
MNVIAEKKTSKKHKVTKQMLCPTKAKNRHGWVPL